jgi:hypothetical protein
MDRTTEDRSCAGVAAARRATLLYGATALAVELSQCGGFSRSSSALHEG